MFQNISGYTVQERKKETTNRWSEVLQKNNILIYILSFMLSFVGIGGDFSLFSVSILGACFSSSIPLLGVVVITLVGNMIGFGAVGALEYFLTSLIFLVSLFILKPKYNEDERNEKIKVAKNLAVAVFLVQIVKAMFSSFTVYDLLLSITYSIIVVAFYKIFVNSLSVIENLGEKKAFSIEEVIRDKSSISDSRKCFWRFINTWIFH